MHNPKRIYLAGPMTGHVESNFPAFHAAAEWFTKAGWEVVNPADNFGGRTDLPRSSYLRADLMLLTQCDALALLPGWHESNGAKLEYLLALELGMVIFNANTIEPLSKLPEILVTAHTGDVSDETILDEAKRLTGTDRNSDYGHPSDDFQRTARMWSGVLASKLRGGEQIAASDVPLCMIAVKLARQAHRHKRDNLVDIAGYARTAAMVAGEK
jgi:nucleoside 2-deoxyribosyltransferase